MLNADILDRLRAATEGTTPGPWHVGHRTIGPKGPTGFTRHIVEMLWVDDEQGVADHRFIAAAPSLIPEAADTIAALRAEVEALKADKRAAWEAGRDAAAIQIVELWSIPSAVPRRQDILFTRCDLLAAYIRTLTPPEV